MAKPWSGSCSSSRAVFSSWRVQRLPCTIGIPDLQEVDLEQSGGGGGARGEGHPSFAGDVTQAVRAQQVRQAASVRQVGPAFDEQLPEAAVDPPHARLLRGHGYGRVEEGARRSLRSGPIRRDAKNLRVSLVPARVGADGPRPAGRLGTRSKASWGASSLTTSCALAVSHGGFSWRSQRRSRSVASTDPVGPTVSASQRAMLPLPAPTSQHDHPGETPSAVGCWRWGRRKSLQLVEVAARPGDRRYPGHIRFESSLLGLRKR